MNTIAFIGLGHMGGFMAKNLLKNGLTVIGYDLDEKALNEHKAAGGKIGNSVAAIVSEAEIIITMLPKGIHVAKVCRGKEGVFANAKAGSLIIDSSTIDVETSKLLAQEAKSHQLSFIDAPVSGGEIGAKNGTLAFMVGGEKSDFEYAKPILSHMGKNLFYLGNNGTGLGAKIANNMLLGITMVGVSEAFNLAEKLGVGPKAFYDVASVSTGMCWALTKNCPVPGVLENTPASHDYKPGFATNLMLKDMRLSQEAGQITQ